MRGYASKCDALLKAGEAIRTPDIHVGNVILYLFARSLLHKKGIYDTMRGGKLLILPPMLLSVRCSTIA